MPLSKCSDWVKASASLCRCLFIGEPAHLKIGGIASMTGQGQSGQTRWRKRWRALLAWGALGLGVAGCSQTPTTSQQSHDPLTGVRVPPGTPIAPATPASSSATQPHANYPGVPPLPTALSATNTATIAGANWQTPGSLAINDRSPIRLEAPGQLTSDPKGQTPVKPGFPSANAQPRVEAVPDAKPVQQPFAPAWQPPAAKQGASAAPALPGEALSK